MRRDAKSITDDIIAAATMDTDDDMEEETVRRSRKRSSKSRRQAEQPEYDEDYFDDFDEDETILPEVVKTEDEQEELPKKRQRRIKADDEITSILDDDDDDDDIEEESESVNNVREVRIPLKGILLTLLILILVTAVTGMGFLCRKNQQRLDEAQDEIRELKSNDSAAQYEAKIKELETKVADLTAQNEFLSSGGLQTVTTTDTSNTGTTTDATSDEKSDEKSDENADKTSDEKSEDANTEAGDKTYIVQNGDSFYSIAQKMYGDGSRYADILEANGMNEDNAKLVVGDEIKIPQ
jgi:LysM repeat protein